MDTGCENTRKIIERRTAQVRRRTMRRSILCCLGVTALATYLLFGVFFGIAVVHGTSMSPTLKEGDVVLFRRSSSGIEQGDIILLKVEPGTDYIKRAVALPGSKVSISGISSTLRVDEQAIDEPYAHGSSSRSTKTTESSLDEHQYYVLGDNRSNSRDSRDYGPVEEEQIDGKALIIIHRC